MSLWQRIKPVRKVLAFLLGSVGASTVLAVANRAGADWVTPEIASGIVTGIGFLAAWLTPEEAAWLTPEEVKTEEIGPPK